eukprot:m51a1_g3753 hypothetical protein (151) ;mRNA; f:77403-78019
MAQPQQQQQQEVDGCPELVRTLELMNELFVSTLRGAEETVTPPAVLSVACAYSLYEMTGRLVEYGQRVTELAASGQPCLRAEVELLRKELTAKDELIEKHRKLITDWTMRHTERRTELREVLERLPPQPMSTPSAVGCAPHSTDVVMADS